METCDGTWLVRHCPNEDADQAKLASPVSGETTKDSVPLLGVEERDDSLSQLGGAPAPREASEFRDRVLADERVRVGIEADAAEVFDDRPDDGCGLRVQGESQGWVERPRVHTLLCIGGGDLGLEDSGNVPSVPRSPAPEGVGPGLDDQACVATFEEGMVEPFEGHASVDQQPQSAVGADVGANVGADPKFEEASSGLDW